MKMLAMIFILSLFSANLTAPEFRQCYILAETGLRDERLLKAIIQVESGGNPSIINWKEQACGLLQIRDVMLNEVNRILQERGNNTRYTHRDCLDSTKSIKMYWIVMDYHNPSGNVFRGCEVWNGRSVKHKYYLKVKKQLNNI
jgi:hypothetical protein